MSYQQEQGYPALLLPCHWLSRQQNPYEKNFGDVSICRSDISILERMSFALLTTESTGNSTLKRSQMNTERCTNFDLLLKMQYCEGPVSQFRGYDVTNKFCIVLTDLPSIIAYKEII